VSFQGRYTLVSEGRLGFVPFQHPHPPLEMAAQSVGATRRAARLTDGVFFGPQIGWDSVEKLAGVFRETRQEAGAPTAGSVGASRALIVGPSREAAATAARAYLEKTFAMYRTWDMQEPTMMELQLSFDVPLESWTVCGSPTDCLETLARASAMGLDRVGFTIYSLPPEPRARIEYLQMIAENIVRPATFPSS
jgi:alkanesulfonate monooxygenase SsuD/methylene tetrahydromethanopterin reductase-like flavin-dependent oxidoreductase (luciferase family)